MATKRFFHSRCFRSCASHFHVQFKEMNKYFILSRNILISLCLGIFLTSCTTMPENNILKEEKNRFFISPEKVTINKPFQINLPEFRPSKIAIKTPLNEWYIVHDVDENIFIVPFSAFEKSNIIVIIPSQLKGIIWESGQKQIRRVFHVLGKYFIYLADNLETEPENTLSFEAAVTLISSSQVSD